MVCLLYFCIRNVFKNNNVVPGSKECALYRYRCSWARRTGLATGPLKLGPNEIAESVRPNEVRPERDSSKMRPIRVGSEGDFCLRAATIIWAGTDPSERVAR